MNPAHFHILIVHLPLVGVVIGLLVLATGMALRSATVKKTGLYLILIPASLAIPAYLSGEGAEEIAERVEGVSHHTTHEHAEWAFRFVWMAGFMVVLCMAALWSAERRKHILVKLYWLALAGGIASAAVGTYAGYLGGKIRHPEAFEQMGPLNGGGDFIEH